MLLEKLILVELDSMNEVHEKEIEILEDLYAAILRKDLNKTNRLIEVFYLDVKQHFAWEEEKMREYQFPAIMKHKMAHMNTLMKLTQVKKQWESENNFEMLQDYFENEFRPWLIKHLNSMDSVTAKFLKETWCE